MFAKKNPLPEAWTVRPRRWYLKDHIFLSEIGGGLGFLGLLLTLLVAGQRAAAGEGPKPSAFEAQALMVIILALFGLMTSGGFMACMRVLVDTKPRSFIRHVGGAFASIAISMTTGVALVWGVTRLVLPLQMFFGWLAMSAGFTLLIVMRQRQAAAAKKAASDVRPVE